MSSLPPAPPPPFEADLELARTLPSRLYLDPGILELERARVFGRTWQPVCALDQVREPGRQLACQVAGEPIVVLRDLDGTLRAFFDVCPHRAGPLTAGPGTSCQRKTLQCRYHGWTFSLDGRLLQAPGLGERPPRELRAEDTSLRPIAVDTFGPLVFVNLRVNLGVNLDANPTPGAEPLAAYLGEIVGETAHLGLDRLSLFARREFAVHSNWKVYVDNYVEGYHIPLVHTGLMRELDYPAYRVETRRLHSKQHAPIRPPDEAMGQGSPTPREYSAAEGDGQGRFYWVFPNVMFNCYPDHLQLNVVLPISVSETVVLFEWYFPMQGPAAGPAGPPSPAELARWQGHVDFADKVQQEDAAICEAVQLRLRSRAYGSGRFVPSQENGVHQFQALLHRYLFGA